MILIGRRGERLNALKTNIMKAYPLIQVHVEALSVTDLEKVGTLPHRLPPKLQNVDILVNNAGLALGITSVEANNVNDAKTVLDTNVLGLIAMCSAFVPQMKARGTGHIINMGSVAGHHTYSLGE